MKKSLLVIASLFAVGTGGAAIVFLDKPPEIRAQLASETEMPPPEQAKAIFADLHGNIYRAFEYSSESDIYDALSQSVDGQLLNEIYNEIYQSLIFRDEGGAVSKIRSVDILESQLLDAPADREALQYRVKSTWEVNSSVWHLTHTHARTNQYQGIYTVGRVDGHWKIVDDRILRQRRVAEDWTPVEENGGA